MSCHKASYGAWESVCAIVPSKANPPHGSRAVCEVRARRQQHFISEICNSPHKTHPNCIVSLGSGAISLKMFVGECTYRNYIQIAQ